MIYFYYPKPCLCDRAKKQKKERHMKKLIAIAIAVVMVVALAVSTAAVHSPADTTAVWVNRSQLSVSFDTFFLDGVSHMDLGWGADGSADAKLSANPVTVGDHESLSLRGWAGIKGDPTVVQYGYRINEGEAVYNDDFAKPTEQAVINAGGDARFLITVPIAGLTEPTLITAVAKGDDGVEYDFIEFSVNGKFSSGALTGFYDMPISSTPGGVGVWVNQANPTTSVKFTTAAPFKGLTFNPQYWASNPAATGPAVDWKVEVFKYSTDNETTLAGDPILSKSYTSTADNNPSFEFGFDEQPAGTYIVRFTITNPDVEQDFGGTMKKPYLVLPLLSENPDPSKFEFSGKPFNLSVLGQATEGDFFVANPSEAAVDPDNGIKVVGKSWDWLALSGSFLTTAGHCEQYIADNSLVAYKFFSNVIGGLGWAQLTDGAHIAGFGYAVDDGPVIKEPSDASANPQFLFDRDAELAGAGIVGGRGFWIVFPYAGLAEGEHECTFYAIDDDGNAYSIYEFPFTVIEAESLCDFASFGTGWWLNPLDGTPLATEISFTSERGFNGTTFFAYTNPGTTTEDTTVMNAVLKDGEGAVLETVPFAVSGDSFFTVKFSKAYPADAYTIRFESANASGGWFVLGSALDNGANVVVNGGGTNDNTLTNPFMALLSADVDEPVDPEITAGTGDVNKDGEINNKDVVLLFRYASDVEIANFDEAAADVNGDGEINNKDVVLLFRWVSNPVELMNVSYDNLFYDATLLFEGSVDKKVADPANRETFDYVVGAVKEIGVRGWVRISEDTADIAGFGYSIDGGNPVKGQFVENRPDLADAGYPGGVGFSVKVPVEDLEIGEHTIDVYLFTKDGRPVKVVKDRSTAEEKKINQVGVTFTISDIPYDPYIGHSLDRLMVAGENASKEATAKQGTPITVLGWAVFEDGLKEIVYELDGVRGACEDVYRDRTDVAAYLGVDNSLGVHAGFGLDSDYMDLLGLENVELGTHELSIIAVSNGGYEKVMKTITLEIIDPNTPDPPPEPKVTLSCVDASTNDGSGVVFARGWTGANYPILALGYQIDDQEPVFELVQIADAEGPVKDAAGANAVRYAGTVPYTDLPVGEHTIKFVMLLADEDETVLPFANFIDPNKTTVFKVQGTVPVVEPGPFDDAELLLLGEINPADVDNAIQMRGFTASPDGKYVYAGLLQGGRYVARFNAADMTLAGTYKPASEDNELYCKGLAVDDRGNLYVGITHAGHSDIAIAVVDKDMQQIGYLSVDLGSANTGINGVAVQKINGRYLLYVVTCYDVDGVRCYDVTDPASIQLYKDFGTDGIMDYSITGADKDPSYIAVDVHGNVYLTYLKSSSGLSKGSHVAKIAPDGKSVLKEVEVAKAYGICEAGDYVFVATYNGASSVVKVLLKEDLSEVAELKYAAQANDLSDIAYGGTKLFVGDHGDNTTVSGRVLYAELGIEVEAPIEPEVKPTIKNKAFNTVWVDGALYCDVGDAADYVAKNPIKGNISSVGIRGWAWIADGEIDVFGYRINDGEPVFNAAFLQDRADVYNTVFGSAGATQATANGYAITAIDVSALEDGEYTITAVVKADDGTVLDIASYPITIERVSKDVKTVNALYELGENEDLANGPHTLTGKITEVVTAYSERYGNITVDIVVEGAEDKPVRCYRIVGEGVDKIGVGDVITVTGELTHFVNSNNNVFEFKQNSTLDSWTSDFFTEDFEGEDFNKDKLTAWAGYKVEGGKLHLGHGTNWVSDSPAVRTKAAFKNYVAEFKITGVSARDCYYGFGIRANGDGGFMNGGRFGVPSAAEKSTGIAIDLFGAANSTLGDTIGITFCDGGENGSAPAVKVARPDGYSPASESTIKVVDTGDTIVISINDVKLVTINLSGLTDGKYTQATVLNSADEEIGTFTVSVLEAGNIVVYQRNDYVTVDDFSISRA